MEHSDALVEHSLCLVRGLDERHRDKRAAFRSPVRGVEGFTNVDRVFRTAFPDFCVKVEDEVMAGDRIATRGYFTGTHSGEFMGMPATGRAIRCSYSDIWRLEDGKGRDNWVQMDMLGLTQQLGSETAERG